MYQCSVTITSGSISCCYSIIKIISNILGLIAMSRLWNTRPVIVIYVYSMPCCSRDAATRGI